MFQGIHIDPVMQQARDGRDQPRTELKIVLPTRQQRRIRHPYHPRIKSIGYRRQAVGMNQQITATDIDLIAQGQGHRLTGEQPPVIPLGGHDGRYLADRRPKGSATTSSPGRTAPAAMVPQKPRKSRWGRLTYCTGKTEIAQVAVGSRFSTFPAGAAGSARVPGHHLGRIATMLSPRSADTGTQRTSRTPSLSTKSGTPH
jgi:hypothetical protein